MGGSYAGNAGVFLVQTLFGLYMGAVLIRFLLAWVRADFYNPISQFLVKVTNPVLVPLRRVIPSLGRIDLATIVLLLALQMLELVVVGLISGVSFKPVGLLVLLVAQLLALLFQIYFVTILIQGVLSWVVAVPLSLLVTPWMAAAMGETIFNTQLVYRYNYNAVFIWLGIILFISVVASIIPARRATQVNVRQSLTYE